MMEELDHLARRLGQKLAAHPDWVAIYAHPGRAREFIYRAMGWRVVHRYVIRDHTGHVVERGTWKTYR